MTLKSKIISVASAAALAVTGLTGLGASATVEEEVESTEE